MSVPIVSFTLALRSHNSAFKAGLFKINIITKDFDAGLIDMTSSMQGMSYLELISDINSEEADKKDENPYAHQYKNPHNQKA